MTPSPDPAEALARAIRQSNSASPTAPTANERTLARAYLTQSERLRAAEGLLREVEQNSAETGQCCLVCDPNEETRAAPQHAPDCALAAFLACQPAREAT